MLYNLQVAYDLLSDEYKRILYDLKNGFRSPEQLSESLSNLSGLLQRRYQDFLNDRNDAYVASVMREYDRSGELMNVLCNMPRSRYQEGALR